MTRPLLSAAALCLMFIGSAHHLSAQLFDKQSPYTLADTLRGSLRPERTCYDVQAYDLTVEVDIPTRSIKGSNDISFEAMADFSRLQIDLFPELTISAITYNGKPLSYSREAAAVFVDFPRTVTKGTKGKFTVDYAGTPREAKNPPWDGGMSWDRDDKGNPWVAVSCQGLGASVWWPNKDHLSDEPERMTITLIAPDTLMAIANGDQIAEKTVRAGMKATTWEVSYPINNYNVTLNIGKYAHFSESHTMADGTVLPLDYYVMEYNLDRARKQFTQVKPMLTCYEQFLGPYPFKNDGFALVETPYLGMEHQGAIAYGNRYKTGYAGFDFSGIGLDFDYIIIHETGHEWWGNHVSMQDLADMWIHEGFCTYSEAIYVECMHGRKTADDYVKAMRRMVSNDRPIIGDYGVNNEGSGDMYQKGAVMLHMLRTLTDNDALWWSIIRGIQKDFGMQTVTTQQIEQYISRKAGKDFSKVFDQYLRHADLPKLEYRLREENGGVQFEYRWVADVEGFNMPLRYANADGAWVWCTPGAEWQQTFIPGVDARTFRLDTKQFWFEERMMRK